MSLKRDWNDMSEDDSQEEHPKERLQKQQEVVIQAPSLNKILSSPIPQKRSNPNEQQNLRKLQNSTKEQIWLFIPLFYKENQEEVDAVFKGYQFLKKIQKFPKGWNVLTSRQNAKNLIVEGRKQGKMFFKFYFSNKNDEQGNYKSNNYRNNDKCNEYDNKKVKYVPKSPNSKLEMKDLKEPQSLRRIQSLNDYDSRIRTPKSPTYKYQQKKNNNKQTENREQKISNNCESELDSGNYRQKYNAKQSKQEIVRKGSDQYNVQSPRKKYKAKVQSQIQVSADTPTEKATLKQTKAQIKEKNEQTQVTPVKNGKQDQSEQNTEKKKKKKNKGGLKDPNNPFSFFD